MKYVYYILGAAFCILFISVLFFDALAVDVTLIPQNATMDSGWKIYEHAPKSGAYWLHTKDTLYKKVTQKMYWTFPGKSGYYRLKIKTGTKRNGKPPVSVSIDEEVVWKGRQPLFQQGEKLWCCGGSRPKKQCLNAPPSQYQIEPEKGRKTSVLTTQRIFIKKGAIVTFHGSTVYPCSDLMGKDLKPGQGGGSYPILYEISCQSDN